jgi:hypothetical protein
MKLVIKGWPGTFALESNLPAGVRLIQRLTSGTLVVDATDAGERTLRQARGLTIATPGTAFVSPPDEFESYSLSDLQEKIEAAKARRLKTAAG